MDKVKSVYVNFVEAWERNKDLTGAIDYNYAANTNVPSYCVLIDQYKLESYRFYKTKLISKTSNTKVIYIWRPKLW